MKQGKQTIIFKNPVHIKGVYSVVGPYEAKGPLGEYFDFKMPDYNWEEKSFEKTECKMHKHAVTHAIADAGLTEDDISCILSGDLLSEEISSSYSARDFDCTYLGLYSACSTYAESMIVGSLLVSGGYFKNVACATCSHFCSAERQYRFPLELGTPRTPLAQWTVTAAGSAVLSAEGNTPAITMATLGKVIDYGVSDANNMGAAMAPAAAHTIITHLKESKREAKFYDLIVTGDLGKLGSELLIELLKHENIDISGIHKDCGEMIFRGDDKKGLGGSGAGCSAVVFNSYFYKQLLQGKIKKMLFVPTGALLSKVSSLQGESIPAIAQAIVIETAEKIKRSRKA